MGSFSLCSVSDLIDHCNCMLDCIVPNCIHPVFVGDLYFIMVLINLNTY